MRHYAIGLILLAFASSTLIGCGGGDWSESQGESSEDTNAVQTPLMQYNGAVLWPGGQVPICFNGRGTSQEAEWLKEGLAHNWSAVTKIDFQYSATCPFPGKQNYIQIDWGPQVGWGVGGGCQVGMQSPTYATLGYCTSGCSPAEDYEEAFKATAVHEIGHGLGFAHEHQRNDSTAPCLPAYPQRTDMCGNELCYPTEEAYQAAVNSWTTNIAVIGDGIKLTSWYDRDSIMNYCRGWTQQTPVELSYQVGYRAGDRLSVGDLYGAQMSAYGNRPAPWLYLPLPD